MVPIALFIILSVCVCREGEVVRDAAKGLPQSSLAVAKPAKGMFKWAREQLLPPRQVNQALQPRDAMTHTDTQTHPAAAASIPAKTPFVLFSRPSLRRRARHLSSQPSP